MPLLSSLASVACEELEWTCLLSLSMLLVSTSFPDWPNAMMAQRFSMYSLAFCLRRKPAMSKWQRRSEGVLNRGFVVEERSH